MPPVGKASDSDGRDSNRRDAAEPAGAARAHIDPAPFHPPVKRSVEIAGHKTSISLEPVFWDMLRARASREGVPINALVARIDALRLDAEVPPGLASAIRVWLVMQE